jgi:hypothetical protein
MLSDVEIKVKCEEIEASGVQNVIITRDDYLEILNEILWLRKEYRKILEVLRNLDLSAGGEK